MCVKVYKDYIAVGGSSECAYEADMNWGSLE